MDADEIRKKMEDESRFSRCLDEAERIEVILEACEGQPGKLYEEGCARLRNELKRIRAKRELLQMIREDQLDAQMKMKLALILSGLTQEESLILMNEFMDKEAERFVILKKLRETENTNPS